MVGNALGVLVNEAVRGRQLVTSKVKITTSTETNVSIVSE